MLSKLRKYFKLTSIIDVLFNPTVYFLLCGVGSIFSSYAATVTYNLENLSNKPATVSLSPLKELPECISVLPPATTLSSVVVQPHETKLIVSYTITQADCEPTSEIKVHLPASVRYEDGSMLWQTLGEELFIPQTATPFQHYPSAEGILFPFSCGNGGKFISLHKFFSISGPASNYTVKFQVPAKVDV